MNGEKIIIHTYNGKQRYIVTGKEHNNFVRDFIGPHLKKKIEACSSKADDLNQNILSNMKPKVSRDKVKFKTDGKSKSVFTCNNCNEITKSITQIHEHIKTRHESTFHTEILPHIESAGEKISQLTLLEDVSLDIVDESLLNEHSGPEASDSQSQQIRLNYKCLEDNFNT